MTWNTCGARLAQVLKHMGKRVMVIALQEVRPPRHTAWASMDTRLSTRRDSTRRIERQMRNEVLSRDRLERRPERIKTCSDEETSLKFE